MSDRFADLIGQVDVAFVVDTTGSMGPFIDAARAQIRSIAEEVGRAGDLDLRFAVVEYRDHPPQDETFAVRPHPFDDGGGLQRALDLLTPSGGGDAPEAVLDGLIAAADLQWRASADRLCFLVGDAPPHGYGDIGDSWPEGCPCRATPNGVIELLNGREIRLHAVSLTAQPSLVHAFRELAEGTGGALTEAPSSPATAVSSVGSRLTLTSEMVDAGRAYLAAAETAGTYDPEALAPSMAMPAEATRGIAAYLKRRGMLGK